MRFKLLSRKLALFLLFTCVMVASVKGQSSIVGYRVFIDNLMRDQTLSLNGTNGAASSTLFSKLIYEKSSDGYHLYDLTVMADLSSSSSVKLTFTDIYKTSVKTLLLPAEIIDNGSFFQWLTAYQNQIIAEEKQVKNPPASAFHGKVVILSCSKTDFESYYNSKLKWKTKKNVFFVNATLGIGQTRRTLQVENPQFRNTEALSERTNGETGSNAFPVSIGFGYRYGNHQFSVGAEYATFGMNTNRPIHNSTGLPTDATENNSSTLQYFLFMGGLTYAYSSHRPGLSSYFQTSLQVGQVNHQDFIVSKTGFGFSYKPNPDFAIKAYPFIQWDLEKINGTEISTHLYNYGLEFGISYFFKL